MKINYFILKTTIFFVIACVSCRNDKNCLLYEQAFVSKVEGSSNGQINQEISLQVYFGCNNGCAQFGNFEENISGNTRTIIVNARYEGCFCIQIAPTLIETYKFKTSQAGTYYLKFLQRNNTYLTDTLTIQ